MRHCKGLIYGPEIEGVRNGTIRQSIRPEGKRHVRVGDTITWHGWAGRPYWSPWSWRLEVMVTEVISIGVRDAGYYVKNHMVIYNDYTFIPWTSIRADHLAAYDGIEPPTGVELGRVLNSLHDLSGNPTPFQIIRW